MTQGSNPSLLHCADSVPCEVEVYKALHKCKLFSLKDESHPNLICIYIILLVLEPILRNELLVGLAL